MRMILEWQCKLCEDIQLSDSIRTHHMDYCKCGKSAVDLEDGYRRYIGDIKEIKQTIYKEE
tara:strand:+ start:2418 stop:2600 length:183 start_codon:yes stop_codon:yes gene_type:complete